MFSMRSGASGAQVRVLLLLPNNGPRCASSDVIMFWSATLMSVLCVELSDTKPCGRSQEWPLTSGSCSEGEREADELLSRRQTTFFLD